MTMTKEQAEVFAGIIIPEIKANAKKISSDLTDEQRAAAPAQALAALDVLSGIEGTFCHVAPIVIHVIDSLGWLTQIFLGAAYAILQSFKAILTQIMAVLCVPAPAPAPAA